MSALDSFKYGKINPIVNAFFKNSFSKNNNRYDDPTIFGFSLIFYKDERSPLLNESSRGDNAYNYLLSIGEKSAAESLKRFREKLSLITNDYPYYFQTLSGLGNIYKFEPKNSLEERTLTIETLESIDLKISSLIEDYIEASWDFEYRRELLPPNMKEFDMSVLVYEVRNIKAFIKNANGNGGFFKDVNEHLGLFEYYFVSNRFDVSNSQPFLESIDNAQGEEAKNKFDIICGLLLNKTIIRDLDFLAVREKGDKQEILNKNPSAIPQSINNNLVPTISGANSQPFKIKENYVASDGPSTLDNPYELNEIQKQVQQLKKKYITDVISSKASSIEFGNVLFRGEKPSIEGLATGTQSLEDINPLGGRVGNVASNLTGGINSAFNKRILNLMFDKQSFLDSKSEGTTQDRLKMIFSQRLDYTSPIENAINKALITSLGQLNFG
jgi:hypothetical protein